MATPPDFSVGQVLTAAQMNAVGLWLVKTQTIAAGSTDVTVTNAFPDDFDVFIMYFTEINRSALGWINCQISGITGSVYSISGIYMNAGSATVNGAGVVVTQADLVRADNNGGSYAEAVFVRPNKTTRKSILIRGSSSATMNNYDIHVASATASNDLRIFTSGGPTFSGTVRIYGYRK
jgi:hypothetical protein